MFCMKCGKKIDDDSNFCQFCGNGITNSALKTGTQTGTNPVMQPANSFNKKMMIVVVSCIVAVAAVIGAVKLLKGGFGKTPAEQLLLMSWTELAELDDLIAKKEIDLDEVRKMIDVDLLDSGIQDSESDLRAIYFMENHGIDIKSDMDVSSDELKRIWYIRNYGWDSETENFVDLSDYNDSNNIYCAMTFNYNVEEKTYFENDFSKIEYLVEKDFNPDTENSFADEDEKRLYMIRNYNYDIIPKSSIDPALAEALGAYNDYIESNYREEGIIGYNLAYIDDNDIPECVVWTGIPKGGKCRVFVLTYRNDSMEAVTVESGEGYSADIAYYPRRGVFWLGMYDKLWHHNDKFELGDSFHKLKSKYYWSDGKGKVGYQVDGFDVSGEYYNSEGYYYINEQNIDDCNMVSIYNTDGYGLNFGGTFGSLLGAYDDLRTIKYTTWAFCIGDFEEKEGILTVKADNGEKADFDCEEGFSFSYPISENCFFESSYNYNDSRRESSVTQLSLSDIENSVKLWRQEYNESPGMIESPAGIRFCILDDEITGIYLATP